MKYKALILFLLFSIPIFSQIEKKQDTIKCYPGNWFYKNCYYNGVTNLPVQEVYLKAIPSTFRTITDTLVVAPPLNYRYKKSELKTELRRYCLIEAYTGLFLRKLDSSEIHSTQQADIMLGLQGVEMPATYRTYQIVTVPKNLNFWKRIFRKRIYKSQEIKIVERQVMANEAYLLQRNFSSEGDGFEYFGKGKWTEWREIISSSCGGDNKTISHIINALKEKGYEVGAANVLDEKTKAALIKFQKENNLPVGSLNFETLKALGVE